MIAEATKPCSMCGVEYALSHYAPQSRRCRVCKAAYQRAWARKRREEARSYRVAPAVAGLGEMTEEQALEWAVEAYKQCGQHYDEKNRLGRRTTKYTGPVAGDYLDAVATCERHWQDLADRVVDKATAQPPRTCTKCGTTHDDKQTLCERCRGRMRRYKQKERMRLEQEAA